MSAAAVIGLPSGRRSRLGAKLRDEHGIGLVELLIALLVLNVGIFATFAAFTSGALALRRASHISTAAAIADKEVEALRNTAYGSIGNQTINPWPNSPDGRTYAVQVALLSTGSQMTTGTYKGSSQVKVVQVTVRDGSLTGTILNTTTSTFSHCNQAGLGTGSDPNPCQS